MPPPRSLLAAGVAVTFAELVTGIAGLIALGPVDVTLFFLGSSVLSGVVMASLWAIVSGRSGPGGPGPDDGDAPSPQPPPWWPGFERDFWAHVDERPRTPA